MSDTLKILGQLKPATNVVESLYTVPSGTQTTVVSLFVCNQSGGSSVFTIALSKAGADLDVKHYIHFGDSLAANSTFPVAAPIMLSAGDVIRVKSGDGNCSFVATGIEVSA